MYSLRKMAPFPDKRSIMLSSKCPPYEVHKEKVECLMLMFNVTGLIFGIIIIEI